MQTYDIYFRGQLMPGAESAQARAAMAKMFKLDERALTDMFSGRAMRIKTAADEATASRYRKAFREAGALIDILPHGEAAPQAAPRQPPDNNPVLTLLPPRTGSLADCAPQVDPTPIPDTAWMRLDEPGTVLDESPTPEQPEYDISAISMAPPDQGSLEDCTPPKADHPLPDISHLALEE